MILGIYNLIASAIQVMIPSEPKELVAPKVRSMWNE